MTAPQDRRTATRLAASRETFPFDLAVENRASVWEKVRGCNDVFPVRKIKHDPILGQRFECSNR
jgi:hypothetical protein